MATYMYLGKKAIHDPGKVSHVVENNKINPGHGCFDVLKAEY